MSMCWTVIQHARVSSLRRCANFRKDLISFDAAGICRITSPTSLVSLINHFVKCTTFKDYQMTGRSLLYDYLARIKWVTLINFHCAHIFLAPNILSPLERHLHLMHDASFQTALQSVHYSKHCAVHCFNGSQSHQRATTGNRRVILLLHNNY